jgi:hypothetical protein
MGVPRSIVCVECGGTAYLLREDDAEDPYQPGEPVAYRCGECLERFDMVVTDEDVDAEGNGPR